MFMNLRVWYVLDKYGNANYKGTWRREPRAGGTIGLATTASSLGVAN